MRFPRSLMVPLMLIGIVPCVAQLPQPHTPAPLLNPFVAQPLPGSRIAPLDFHAGIPATTMDKKDVAQHRITSPSMLKRFDLFGSGPGSFRAPATLVAGLTDLPPGDPAQTAELTMRLRQRAMEMAADSARRGLAGDGRCYAIRDYQFSRVSPNSDATRLSGTSTCEPASQARLKSAAGR